MKLPQNLSPGFLRALPPEERVKHEVGSRSDLPPTTAPEFVPRQSPYEAGQERKLQRDIALELNRRKIPFVHPRMDKKTTTQKGTPDFVACIGGHFVAIEAKTKYGSLSVNQVQVMAEVTRANGVYLVARSLEDVIRAIDILVTKPL